MFNSIFYDLTWEFKENVRKKLYLEKWKNWAKKQELFIVFCSHFSHLFHMFDFSTFFPSVFSKGIFFYMFHKNVS